MDDDEQYLGQIRWKDRYQLDHSWKVCDGQLHMVYMQMALFSILGTTYGGDGRQHFAVPDLGNVAAPGDDPGPPRRGPGAGTMVPYIDAEGNYGKVAVETLPSLILPAEGQKDNLRPCICANGWMPKRS